jgi:undecaprenyl diphosphate synthase
MHIAIIMDGNGRWALRRGLPRSAGHRAGAKAVDRIVQASVRRGVDTLSLFAFSADNWHRPAAEVNALMRLLRRYLFTQTRRCLEQHIRINIIGRRDRLDASLCRAIELSEQATAHCSGLHLRIAVDYSSQGSLMALSERVMRPSNIGRAGFLALLAQIDHSDPPAPEVDLLIRTGGERRLSDFLLWECAYAELHFVDCLWPDFDQPEFDAALDEYAGRERRFGWIAATAAADAGRV